MENETLRRLVLSYQRGESSLNELLVKIQDVQGNITETDLFVLVQHYVLNKKEIEACLQKNPYLKVVKPTKPTIHLCNGDVCKGKRSEAIMNFISEQEGYDVQSVPCCGMCSMGPIAFVDGESFIDINSNFSFKMVVKQKR